MFYNLQWLSYNIQFIECGTFPPGILLLILLASHIFPHILYSSADTRMNNDKILQNIKCYNITKEQA